MNPSRCATSRPLPSPLSALPGGHLARGPIAVCALLLASTAGCSKPEEPIQHYQVAVPSQQSALPPGHDALAAGLGRSAAAGAAQKNTRMLAALIPRGRQTWFFKVTGPADALDPYTDAFRQFLRSVRFPKDAAGRPTWKLPDGWQQEGARGMRYATIHFGPKDHRLAMSVIPLPTAGDADAYALSNINRWRGQLALPPITAGQLASETESIELSDGKATMVRLLGTFRPGGMGGPRGPMAGPPAGPLAGASPRGPAAGQPHGAAIRYTTPSGWVEGRASGMRKAAFRVGEKGQQAEITVIDLAAAAGDLLPNINRWRGQIKLDPIDQTALDQQLQAIDVDGRQGHYVRLIGPEDAAPREAILGVIVIDAGRAWFIKMKGPARLVEQQRDAFEAFVRSIKFATS